jgi:hypothetical protein
MKVNGATVLILTIAYVALAYAGYTAVLRITTA